MRPARRTLSIFVSGFTLFAGMILCSLPSAPAFAGLDAPHNSDSSLGCLSCHDLASTQPKLMPEELAHSPQNIDDTLFNNMCWSCHNENEEEGTAPYVLTHSSRNATARYGNWTVDCWVCHSLHNQEQLRQYGSESYLYSGNSEEVGTDYITDTDASWENDEFAGMLVVPNTANVDYNYTITGNTATALTVKGTIDTSKVTAGDPFAIVLGKLIRKSINLANISYPDPADEELKKSGKMTVRFFRHEQGPELKPNSFADGNATYDGVCEVCHTRTYHFQNDGSSSDPLHANLGPGIAGSNCTTCHSHANGFAHGGGSGTGCIECHGHDAGTLYDPDMSLPYTAGATASPGCGTVQSHSTHTETVGDDLKGPGIYCDTCHNINKIPLFRSVADPDAELTLTDTDVCDACHSQGGSYDGLDDPVLGAKTIWKSGAYVATSDSSLQAGKEKWCATCHDESPSVMQGVSAPKVIGDEQAATRYGTGYGFYKTGHGLASGTYAASGGAAAQCACTDCHDPAAGHIDGDARTYAAASNNYQAGYRLLYPMDIPRVDTGWPVSDFALCARCHDITPFIARNPAGTSLYNIQAKGTSTDLTETVLTDSTRTWGVNEFLFDGCMLIPDISRPWNIYPITGNTETTITVSGSMLADGAQLGDTYWIVCNGHRYHLQSWATGGLNPTNGRKWDSDWSAYIDEFGVVQTEIDSMISCPTCHNVHGSKYGRMVRDGELISQIYNRRPGLDFYYVDSGYSYANPTPLAESIGAHWSNGQTRMCANCHGTPDARYYRFARETVSMSSAANQYFSVGDAATGISTITIIDNVRAGSVNAAGDIRIRIPDSLNMTWDNSDTSAVMGGTASAKVNDTVSFPDSKTLLIDVISDFAAGDTLTVAGLSFTNFTALSSSDNLELYVDEGHSLCTEDTKTIQVGTKAIISSNGDQTFAVDDWPTPISPITVMAITDGAEINSGDDIRIKIPSTFSMVWDTTDISAIIEGAASGKVDTTVSFPDEKTLLIDVTDDFTEGDTITISDLRFKSFFAASAADNLELYVDGVSDEVSDGWDDKTVTIETRNWISPVDILRGQCSEEMSGYDTLIDNDLATGNLWPGANGIFDLGKEYLVTHIRIYAQYDNKWRVYVGNTPSDCLSDGTDVTGLWRIGHDGVRWYEMTVTPASGRYLRLKWENVGGYPGDNTLMEIEFFGTPLDELVMSSAADQEFEVGQPVAVFSPITVTESAANPTIAATNDIRIVIPSALNMSWNTSDTSATMGGTALAKVNGTVSYPDPKTLLIDVTTDFAAGDTLTVDGLSFTDFLGQSDPANLQLSVDGGLSFATTDPQTVRIWDWISPVDVVNSSPDCCDLNSPGFIIDNNTATGNTPWGAGYAFFDLGDTYTVTAIRVYINSAVYNNWDISIGDDTTECTLNSYATMVQDEWYVPVDNEWYSTEIDPPVSGRYIRIDKDAGGGLNDKGLREIDFQGFKTAESRQLRLASAADQSFEKDQAATPIQTINITYYPSNGAITAADDIRISIPAGFNMNWDTTDTEAVIGGIAAAKVSGTVSYPDNKTLLIDVTSDFSAGDSISVSGLSFTDFSAQSPKNHLQLSIDGSASVAATDSKYIWVIHWQTPTVVYDGCTSCCGADNVVDGDTATGNCTWGGPLVFDMGEQTTVRHMRMYAGVDRRWVARVSDSLTGCTDILWPAVKWEWYTGVNQWSETPVIEATGRYIRLYIDLGGPVGAGTIREFQYQAW